MSGDYASFLAAKARRAEAAGPVVGDAEIHPFLHPWQRRVVAWAVRTGRAALWEDTGHDTLPLPLSFATARSVPGANATCSTRADRYRRATRMPPRRTHPAERRAA